MGLIGIIAIIISVIAIVGVVFAIIYRKKLKQLFKEIKDFIAIIEKSLDDGKLDETEIKNIIKEGREVMGVFKTIDIHDATIYDTTVVDPFEISDDNYIIDSIDLFDNYLTLKVKYTGSVDDKFELWFDNIYGLNLKNLPMKTNLYLKRFVTNDDKEIIKTMIFKLDNIQHDSVLELDIKIHSWNKKFRYKYKELSNTEDLLLERLNKLKNKMDKNDKI